VLYFYPKDNTPGCTQQGSDFRDRYAVSRAAGCEIAGVSRDSLKSHEGQDRYGRKVRGIGRSTFVIDREGKRAREWRGVKVPGHVEEVLNFAKAL
jgi:peroxiredoxin Q/BCP